MIAAWPGRSRRSRRRSRAGQPVRSRRNARCAASMIARSAWPAPCLAASCGQLPGPPSPRLRTERRRTRRRSVHVRTAISRSPRSTAVSTGPVSLRGRGQHVRRSPRPASATGSRPRRSQPAPCQPDRVSWHRLRPGLSWRRRGQAAGEAGKPGGLLAVEPQPVGHVALVSVPGRRPPRAFNRCRPSQAWEPGPRLGQDAPVREPWRGWP